MSAKWVASTMSVGSSVPNFGMLIVSPAAAAKVSHSPAITVKAVRGPVASFRGAAQMAACSVFMRTMRSRTVQPAHGIGLARSSLR
jgi:hypothetical protein